MARRLDVDADVFVWRSNTTLGTVDDIGRAARALDAGIGTRERAAITVAACRTRGAAKGTWSEAWAHPAGRQLRGGRLDRLAAALRRARWAASVKSRARPARRRHAGPGADWDRRWDRPTGDAPDPAREHGLTGFLRATRPTPAQVEVGKVQPLRPRKTWKWMRQLHGGSQRDGGIQPRHFSSALRLGCPACEWAAAADAHLKTLTCVAADAPAARAHAPGQRRRSHGRHVSFAQARHGDAPAAPALPTRPAARTSRAAATAAAAGGRTALSAQRKAERADGGAPRLGRPGATGESGPRPNGGRTCRGRERRRPRRAGRSTGLRGASHAT